MSSYKLNYLYNRLTSQSNKQKILRIFEFFFYYNVFGRDLTLHHFEVTIPLSLKTFGMIFKVYVAQQILTPKELKVIMKQSEDKRKRLLENDNC